MSDHVHMMISIPPKYAVSQVIGFIKGKSAIHLARVYGLLSPVFCRNFGSGCEPECLHFVGVLSFDDEFREDVACGGIQEKFRHALAQGIGHDQL